MLEEQIDQKQLREWVEHDFPRPVEHVGSDGCRNSRSCQRIHEHENHQLRTDLQIQIFRLHCILNQQNDADPSQHIDQIVQPGAVDKEIVLDHVHILMIPEEVIIVIQEFRMCNVQIKRIPHA